MLFSRALLLLSQLALGALAVQSNLAGVIDWHKALVGVPLSDTGRTTSPTFHNFKLANGTARSSIVLLTESNVVASLSGEDGSIDWRHQLPRYELVLHYAVKDNAVILLASTNDGAIARRLDALTGAVLWESVVVEGLEQEMEPSFDIIIAGEFVYVQVGGGGAVAQLSFADGSRKNTWAEDLDGHLLFDRLVLMPSGGVSALAYQAGIASLTLSLYPLDPQSPLLSSSSATIITSNIGRDARPIVVTPEAIAWTHEGALWVYELKEGAQAVQQDPESKFGSLSPVGMDQEGYFVVPANGVPQLRQLSSGSAEVKTSFSPVAHDSLNSYAGSIGAGGGLAVSKVSFPNIRDETHVVVVEMISVDKLLGLTTTQIRLPYDSVKQGPILQATTQVCPATGTVRTLVTSLWGSVYLYKDDALVSTRYESLAQIKHLTFVSLPEALAFEDDALVSNSGFTRHLAQLKHIPDYILRFASQFFTSTSAVIAPPATHNGDLHRDAFGLRKVVVATTAKRTVFGLDSLDGSVLWSYAWDPSFEKDLVDLEGVWVTKEASVGEIPVVAVLATETSSTGTFTTVGIELNALTGEPLGTRSVVREGSPSGVFLVDAAEGKTIQVLFKDGETLFFPRPAALKRPSHLTIAPPRRGSSQLDANWHPSHPRKFEGFASEVDSTVVTSLWKRTLDPLEWLSCIASPSTGPVASLGKVTGDRTVLYKYLNPHLLAYSTINYEDFSATVYVIDTITGSTVFKATHEDIHVHTSVEVLLVENWLVYTYKGAVGDLPGGQMVVSVELYEPEEGKKLKSSEITSISADHAVQAFSRTYLLGVGVRSLGVTATRHGITAKDLIVATDSNQIVTIPRRALDPRRPTGPPTASDKAEMLAPYEPYLPLDPKRVVSHTYEVLGVKSIYSSPALLESTSIVLASGLDLFQTRVMPSGGFDVLPDSFNKFQLVLTILGLTAGIAVSKPIVEKRKLRARWY